MKKPKLQTSDTKSVSVKFGASAASKKSPLSTKKSYSKTQPQEGLISNANFGQTGLTGES